MLKNTKRVLGPVWCRVTRMSMCLDLKGPKRGSKPRLNSYPTCWIPCQRYKGPLMTSIDSETTDDIRAFSSVCNLS